MTKFIKSEWGFAAKFMYKHFIRDLLVKAVKSTKTDFDDKVLAVLDELAGYKK